MHYSIHSKQSGTGLLHVPKSTRHRLKFVLLPSYIHTSTKPHPSLTAAPHPRKPRPDMIKTALNEPSIRRMARRGGVKRIQLGVYDVRSHPSPFPSCRDDPPNE